MKTRLDLDNLIDIERTEEAIARGGKAAGALRSIKPFIEDLIAARVSSLVMGGESMANERMRSIVGEITGLKRLLSSLESQVEKGRIESERRDGR